MMFLMDIPMIVSTSRSSRKSPSSHFPCHSSFGDHGRATATLTGHTEYPEDVRYIDCAQTIKPRAPSYDLFYESIYRSIIN